MYIYIYMHLIEILFQGRIPQEKPSWCWRWLREGQLTLLFQTQFGVIIKTYTIPCGKVTYGTPTFFVGINQL